MSYEVFRYIFIAALILCGIFFVVSAILFFALNIPKVIRDLSGMTAKKAIREIREQNEKTGEKSYKVSQVNRDRGKLTDKISDSGRIIKRSTTMQIGYGVETAKIAESPQNVVPVSQETSVLGVAGDMHSGYVGGGETSVLEENMTAQLAYSYGETDVLNAEMPIVQHTVGETAILSEIPTDDNTSVLTTEPVNSVFAIEFDITLIHTNETIGGEATV